MLEIGVNTNNECGKDIQEVLTNIKKAGFNNIMATFKHANPEEVLEKATKLGLNIPLVHLSQDHCLWSKGKNHDEFVATLKHQIELAGKYGVPVAVLHATHGRPDVFPLPVNEYGLNSILDIVKFAKKRHVKIALENVEKPGFKHFLYVLDNIKDNNLGLCYDVGHHQLYAPKVDILKKYGDRIMAIHLHDNLMDWEYGDDWTRDLHRLPFDGKIDYAKVISKLATTHFRGVMLLEVHKNSIADTKSYAHMSNLEFLTEARHRAEKLTEMLETARSKKK